ncbi:hypothetical protein [Chlamydiifrater volucris]|uniref:hypothetical protein n=1 Tax=Chlamydiifrater volucris TaxID=2681470 RepID=UPI001BCE40C3|nr:hypothetical protein [Chlamydiifrater volucris]
MSTVNTNPGSTQEASVAMTGGATSNYDLQTVRDLQLSHLVMISRKMLFLTAGIMAVSAACLIAGLCLGWLNIALVTAMAVTLVLGALVLLGSQRLVYQVKKESSSSPIENPTGESSVAQNSVAGSSSIENSSVS